MVDTVDRLQRGSVRTISGRVVRITDEDEFILRDRTGRISVDAVDDDDRPLDLTRGQTVTVIGRLDDDDFEFEALRISRGNGSVVFDRLQSFPASRGDDLLVGGQSRDRLNGGRGNDVLIGKFDRDVLTGGAGRDRFIYRSFAEGGDRITDFSPTADVINLRSLFRDSSYSGSQSFADDIQLVQRGANTVVKIDPDGAGGIDGFRRLVVLNDVSADALTADNFLV